MGGGRQVITVKGLAEKPVLADHATWTVGMRVTGNTFAETLSKLRAAKPNLDKFLSQQGFDKAELKDGEETVGPNMVEDESRKDGAHQIQKGFIGSQDIEVSSKDLGRIKTAAHNILEFEASDQPVTYASPSYLVSNLEDIKMSLIGAATKNAQKRAEEFAKNGNAKVGAMRSASQGAFYILPADANVDPSDYGGTYDKSTPEKKARVVVTIEYNMVSED